MNNLSDEEQESCNFNQFEQERNKQSGYEHRYDRYNNYLFNVDDSELNPNDLLIKHLKTHSFEGIKKAIEQGADPNYKHEITPLILRAYYLEIIQYLIKE